MDNIDQETANGLFREGAILVLLDVPCGTEFGIDYFSCEVGPDFKGVKMIPPGVHFVYYSAVNSTGQAAPRSGFFYNFRQREMVIKKWDPKLEDIGVDVISSEEQESFEGNKQHMDKFLGPYPYESYKKWISFSSHLSKDTITRLQPASGRINSVPEFQSVLSTTQSRREAALAAEQSGQATTDNQGLPIMNRIPGTMIAFVDIPKKWYPEGATAAQITKYSMDHSYMLEHLLETHFKGQESELLGELQFAFVCFLMGQVYDGFEHWKNLVHLICTCDAALGERTAFFDRFISVLHHQVEEIPEDFFVDIVSRDNFLTSTLSGFFENIENCGVDSLEVKARKFRKHLEKKFKWDFSEETGDEAPVVVY